MAKYVKEKYFQIEIAQLKAGSTLTFHLFLYLPLNGHIIPLKRPGDVLEQSLLTKIKDKGVGELYIMEDERHSYLNYLNPPKPFKVDEEKAQELATAILSDDKEAQAEAKEAIQEIIVKAMESAPDIDPALMDILGHPSAEHATSVAIYSILFSIAVGQNESTVLADLAVAALIHDVGVTQVAPISIKNPLLNKSSQEWNEYSKHVPLGIGLLAEVGYLPKPQVRMMMEQHHEKFDGTGYPKRIQGFKIQEMSQIVGMADFCDSLMRGWFDGKGHTLPDALSILTGIEKETTFPHYFNPDLFKKVVAWLQDGSGEAYMSQATQMAETTKKKFLKAG